MDRSICTLTLIVILLVLFGCNKTVREDYPDGTIHKIYRLKNKNLHGNFIEYYPNGKIKIEAKYKDGLKNGLYESYYPNGNIEYKTEYIKDRKNGSSKKFDDQGKLLIHSIFESDSLIYQAGFMDSTNMLTHEYRNVDISIENKNPIVGETVDLRITSKGLFDFYDSVSVILYNNNVFNIYPKCEFDIIIKPENTQYYYVIWECPEYIYKSKDLHIPARKEDIYKCTKKINEAKFIFRFIPDSIGEYKFVGNYILHPKLGLVAEDVIYPFEIRCQVGR